MSMINLVGELACEEIATLRHRLQRVSNRKIIFLEKIHLKINEVPTTTLLALGEMARTLLLLIHHPMRLVLT